MNCKGKQKRSGGGREIRTLGGLSPSPVFKTGAINRSAIPPHREAGMLLQFCFPSTGNFSQNCEKHCFDTAHPYDGPRNFYHTIPICIYALIRRFQGKHLKV